MKIEKKIKQTAIEAASLSAEMLKKEYYKFSRNQVKMKSDHEIVTKFDLKSEEIIIKNIRKSFPDHQILSEEAGDNKKKSDYLWLIDPIDGTTNFSIHNPLWSISIALLYKKEIIMGLILAPILNELYVAEKNKGSFLNGKKIITPKANKNKVINTYCHGSKDVDIKKAIKYYQHQKINHLDCRQLGSAAIELSYVAIGRVESIVIPGANPWDVAAGALIVREAGGIVTDFSGKEWNINSKNILASNKVVHKEIVKTLEKLKIK